MSDKRRPAKVAELIGITLDDAETSGDQLLVFTCGKRRWEMRAPKSSCCDSVNMVDIAGDLGDLIDEPIVMAEVVTEVFTEGTPMPIGHTENEPGTWTFVKLATVNGYVTLRWYGSSGSGMYSEVPEFFEITP